MENGYKWKENLSNALLASCIKCIEHIFTCGRAYIQVVDKYRYLGLVLNEFMDMSQMAKVVAQAELLEY